MRRLSLVALGFVFGCGSNPQTPPDAHVDAAVDAGGSDMGSDMGSGSGSGSGGDGFAMQVTPHDRGLDITVFGLGIVIAIPTGKRARRKKKRP
ncbi:MAG TPA: hypothetical protein VGG74_17080 [Kofleriaceae bacterium]